MSFNITVSLLFGLKTQRAATALGVHLLPVIAAQCATRGLTVGHAASMRRQSRVNVVLLSDQIVR
jgi:hypothetical protein